MPQYVIVRISSRRNIPAQETFAVYTKVRETEPSNRRAIKVTSKMLGRHPDHVRKQVRKIRKLRS